MYNNSLNVGDSVSWDSAAGHLHGTIVQIIISSNAAHQLVPWITIERTVVRPDGRSIQVRARMCATDSNLKMMRVTRLSGRSDLLHGSAPAFSSHQRFPVYAST